MKLDAAEEKKGRWKAASAAIDYLTRRFEKSSPDENTRANDHMRRMLAGEDVEVVSPNPSNDVLAGKLLYCIFDATKALKDLEHHLDLIAKNPAKNKVPESDYIEIVAASFDATCFVLHERLKALYQLLRKNKLSSGVLDYRASIILKLPDRKSSGKSHREERTAFDDILAERVVHTHTVNVERARIPRVSLVETLAAGFAVDQNLSLGEVRRSSSYRRLLNSAVKDARARNIKLMRQKLELAELAADGFLEVAAPALDRYFRKVTSR